MPAGVYPREGGGRHDKLTPLAAVGLVLTMIGALTVNVRHGNRLAVVENIVLLLLASFVAYGRFLLVPA